MKTTELRCMDYLEWLTGQEGLLLGQISVAWETGNHQDSIELGETLQIIREIKGIVAKYEGGYDGPETC